MWELARQTLLHNSFFSWIKPDGRCSRGSFSVLRFIFLLFPPSSGVSV